MANLIDASGKLMSRADLQGFIVHYNTCSRGSKEFAAIPRAMIIVMDNLAMGKTTYVKCRDGSAQLVRRKDNAIAINGGAA